MKNINPFFLTLLFLLCYSCSVNDYTSILTVVNKGEESINDIQIGDTVIIDEIFPGQTENYYIYSDITGKLTSKQALSASCNDQSTMTLLDGTYTLFAGNYFYYCNIIEKNEQHYLILSYEPFTTTDDDNTFAQSFYKK